MFGYPLFCAAPQVLKVIKTLAVPVEALRTKVAQPDGRSLGAPMLRQCIKTPRNSKCLRSKCSSFWNNMLMRWIVLQVVGKALVRLDGDLPLQRVGETK